MATLQHLWSSLDPEIAALAYCVWCWFWVELARRTFNSAAVMARRWQEHCEQLIKVA